MSEELPGGSQRLIDGGRDLAGSAWRDAREWIQCVKQNRPLARPV